MLIENLKREMPPEKTFKVAIAGSGFEAGIQAQSFQPDCAVVDFSDNKAEALQICQNLRRQSDAREIAVIALLSHGDELLSVDRANIDEMFTKPFDPSLLVARIRTLVNAHKELA